MTNLISDLKGRFFKRKINAELGKVILEKKVSFDSKTYFEGGNRIAQRTSLRNIHVGYASYIGNTCQLSNCFIGRFCSIGSHVHIIRGTHPIHFVSMHPAFYSLARQSGFTYSKNQEFNETAPLVYRDQYATCIGNDVWIGTGVKIIEGVSIGDGSVVAAGAVVTKDVPPYAIVGGVDAKIIKYRFDENVRESLMSLKWWEWPLEKIKNKASLFLDVKKFLETNK